MKREGLILSYLFKGEAYDHETRSELIKSGYRQITETKWENIKNGTKYEFKISTSYEGERYISHIELIENGDSSIINTFHNDKTEILESIYPEKVKRYEKKKVYANPTFNIIESPSKCLKTINEFIKSHTDFVETWMKPYKITKIEIRHIPRPFNNSEARAGNNPFCEWKRLTPSREGKYYGNPICTNKGVKYVLMPIRHCAGDFLYAYIS